MAAMSVIGIDLGNESCYVAVAKAGGIETIANDYSMRATPSYVAFSGKNRFIGVAAKNQQVTNIKNTIYGTKRLLGRKYSDPHVQRELQYLPYNVIELHNGKIGIKVNYLDEEHVFSPEQCQAMLFTKLKDFAVAAVQTPVNDCVISVPSYFTNNERKALLDSAAIAGLNVLRLINETTATALTYGIYKQDLPAQEEKPRNVFFVDWGHSALQVAACSFNKGKLKILATSADPNLGGRNIDLILADHLCKEFLSKYKVDARTSPRAFIRLLAEVEKLKKQMSANSTTLPLAIECFMEDKDVRSEMKRADMESLCAHLFQRVESTLQQCFEQSALQYDDIYSVEIVGGSTRVPAIKKIIEKVYRKVASTTLNQDEAVSRGCALQCAILSPAVRVRDFNVTDVQTYPIVVSWDASISGEGQGQVEVFPSRHAAPFSKILTFHRDEPFSLRACYSDNIPYPDSNIGTWTVKDIKPSVDGKGQKVKVKVRVNIHGIFTVSSASLIECKDNSEAETMDEDKLENEPSGVDQQQSSTSSQQQQEKPPNAEANSTAPEDGEEKKKKKIIKSIDLPIEAQTYGFTQTEINQYTEQEFKMIAADKQEKERADARNALEEYVYELRGKLSTEEDLASYIVEKEREQLIQQLDGMENWLYEEGEDCNKQIYQEKLSDLKTKGEPIQTRRIEYELRPAVLEDFSRCLQLGMKALEQMKTNNPKFAHITEEEVNKLEQAISQCYEWLEQTRASFVNAPKHLPPPITIAQIRQEKANFESIINPIVNKPPPKAPSPPKDEAAKQAQENHEKQNEQQQTDEPQEQTKSSESQSQEKMEWTSW